MRAHGGRTGGRKIHPETARAELRAGAHQNRADPPTGAAREDQTELRARYAGERTGSAANRTHHAAQSKSAYLFHS